MQGVVAMKVALLVGGKSSEREVSLVTGEGFRQALEKMKIPYVVIDAGDDLAERLRAEKPDKVLLALHGKLGEDGTVQGICEFLKIPYSGSGVLGSALGMDKVLTKEVLKANQIPVAKGFFYNAKSNQPIQIPKDMQFPIVVKPSRDGSSMGVRICKTEADVAPAIKDASVYDYEIVVEEFIAGMELTVPILDNRALTPIEIMPAEGWYDYQKKYTKGATNYFLPPRLPEPMIEECKRIALRVHQVCKAKTYSRVDFRIHPERGPFVLEINTLPGCTPTSLLPKAAAHEGISFEQFIKILLDRATLDYENLR